MHENWARPRYKSNLLGKKMRTCKIIDFDSHAPMPYLSLDSLPRGPGFGLGNFNGPCRHLILFLFLEKNAGIKKWGLWCGLIDHAMKSWIVALKICPMPSPYFSPGMRYAQCLVHI